MKRQGLCLLFVGLLLGQVGCSHVAPKPLPEETRAQLDPVAVVPARFAPSTEFRTPAKGGVAGTGRGAATGAVKGMGLAVQAGQGCFSYGCAVVLALIPAGGIVGAVIGAVHGGVTAAPAAVVESFRKAYVSCLTQRGYSVQSAHERNKRRT